MRSLLHAPLARHEPRQLLRPLVRETEVPGSDLDHGSEEATAELGFGKRHDGQRTAGRRVR